MPATTPAARHTPRDDRSHRHSEAYRDYLASPEWASVRAAALARAGNACEECRATENLEVHHLTYEWLGEEEPSDLKVLCRFHHELADQRRRTLAATARNERGGWWQ